MDIPLNNILEEALRDVPQHESDIDNNAMLIAMLMEQQKAKVELAKLYISDTKYKTELNTYQRDVMPIMMQIAMKPFESTEQFLLKIGKPRKFVNEALKQQEIDFLRDYIPEWLSIGIAKDRKGRKEDAEVLKSLVSGDMEVKTQERGNKDVL